MLPFFMIKSNAASISQPLPPLFPPSVSTLQAPSHTSNNLVNAFYYALMQRKPSNFLHTIIDEEQIVNDRHKSPSQTAYVTIVLTLYI
jgi:hypothetical protein